MDRQPATGFAAVIDGQAPVDAGHLQNSRAQSACDFRVFIDHTTADNRQ